MKKQKNKIVMLVKDSMSQYKKHKQNKKKLKKMFMVIKEKINKWSIRNKKKNQQMKLKIIKLINNQLKKIHIKICF